MGAWGTGIFSDDTACDIRAEFRELIGDGVSVEVATKKLVAEYKTDLDDPQYGSIFWLALAATQSRCGRLQDFVKRQALKVIDSGADLEAWRETGDTKLLKKREAVLIKLRGELCGPQPKPTKIRKVYHDRTDWKIGHAVSYRLLSGRFVIMRVIGINEDHKDLIPIVELCDWVGLEMPTAAVIAKLPVRHTRFWHAGGEQGGLDRWRDKHDHKFTVYSLGPRDFPRERVQVVATGLRVKQSDIIGATYFGGWKRLDEYLKDEYRLE